MIKKFIRKRLIPATTSKGNLKEQPALVYGLKVGDERKYDIEVFKDTLNKKT